MEFGIMIASKRAKKFDMPPTNFLNKYKERIGCSLAHYLKIEAGKVLAAEKIMLALVSLLELDAKKATSLWLRDHLSDPQHKAWLDDINAEDYLKKGDASRSENVGIITGAQKELMLSDSKLWEIVSYVSTFYGIRNVSTVELIKKFNLSKKELIKKTSDLVHYGLLLQDDKNYFHTKKWLYVPNAKEFCKLRDLNIEAALSSVLKSSSDKRFRDTLCRGVTPKQAKDIEQKVTVIKNYIVNLPHLVKDARPFVVGFFGGSI